MPEKINKPFSGQVVLIADTYIDGEHLTAGTVRNVNATNYSLLREANRCEIFDPANQAHQTCLAATRKLDAAKKEADARKQKAAEDAEHPDASPEAQAAAAKAAKAARIDAQKEDAHSDIKK